MRESERVLGRSTREAQCALPSDRPGSCRKRKRERDETEFFKLHQPPFLFFSNSFPNNGRYTLENDRGRIRGRRGRIQQRLITGRGRLRSPWWDSVFPHINRG